jgi:adenine phosphoribosyltransferase
VDQIHAALADAVPGDRCKANLLAHRVAVHADFPRPGVRFKDLSPIIAHPAHFVTLTHLAAAAVVHYNIIKVVGLDARGFIYGAALAREVGAGFVMARKKGKLPGAAPGPHSGSAGLAEVAYTTEYSSETLQLQAGSIAPGDCVVVCDDLVATGGSLKAACDLVTAAGGSVAACVVMAAVEPLRARAEALLGGIPIHVVLPEARQ